MSTQQRISIKAILDRLDWLADNDPARFHHFVNTSGLEKYVQDREREIATKFFSEENLARIGQREGKPDFLKTLTAMRDNPNAFTQRQKQEMLQFISNQYNDTIGAPRTTLKFYSDPQNANTYGYYGTGGKTIYVNTANPEFNNFSKVINTVTHENTHCAQFFNPNMYGNPVLSRIFRANFRAYRNAQKHGFKAYEAQIVEVGARAAGEAAEKTIGKLPGLGKTPDLKDFWKLAANSPILWPETSPKGRAGVTGKPSIRVVVIGIQHGIAIDPRQLWAVIARSPVVVRQPSEQRKSRIPTGKPRIPVVIVGVRSSNQNSTPRPA